MNGPKMRHYGLKKTCLSFTEVLAQSVANISPTTTPLLIIPFVFASASSGTWLAYLFATIGLVLVGMNINQFASRSATPGSLYSFTTKGLGVSTGFISGWCLIVAYLFTAMALLAGAVNYADILLQMIHIKISTILLLAIGAGLAWFIAFKDVKLSTRMMLAMEGLSVVLILLLSILIVNHK